jgi:hypothetical protein
MHVQTRDINASLSRGAQQATFSDLSTSLCYYFATRYVVKLVVTRQINYGELKAENGGLDGPEA